MNTNYIEAFSQSLKHILEAMADISCQPDIPQEGNSGFLSQGLAVVIGITGKKHGRVILDTSMQTARNLSEIMNEDKDLDEQAIVYTLAELTNIVCGHMVTVINNADKECDLVLTPPSVFFGSTMKISSPKINSQIVNYSTPIGEFTANIGIGGSV